jgi:hypothetical protein
MMCGDKVLREVQVAVDVALGVCVGIFVRVGVSVGDGERRFVIVAVELGVAE